jgi:hypothetical protein
MVDLSAIFEQLGAPKADSGSVEAFDARPVPRRPQWRVAKSEAGLPAILVAVDAPPGTDRPLAVCLANLRVEHNVRCGVSRQGGGVEVARYSIIQCLSGDSDVQACFLRTIGGALVGLEGRVEAKDLVELVDRLIVLFRLVARPRERAIHGLWAELFVILSANDPAVMIDAWHSQSVEHFDFGRGDERLEVKSSSIRSREHVFSFEQVYPPSGASVLVASVYVEEQTNGRSLGYLWDQVVDAAPSGEARLKVERVCIETLGQDLGAGRAFSADWNLAVGSIAFYQVTSIPRPAADCPPGVSQLRFRSDLSLADPAVALNLGEFHRCCVGVVTPL